MRIFLLTILGTLFSVGALALSFLRDSFEEWLGAFFLMCLGIACFVKVGTLL